LARYAHENMSESPYYRSKYDTELLYVDHDNHRVLIRSKATKMEEYVSYDLLVGADGVRSTVREALVKKHFDFEIKVSDIFQNFKAVPSNAQKEFLHPQFHYCLHLFPISMEFLCQRPEV
jgi:2-polyprenyl-6-methoxyphenol hydroxylase-like FAD-dependent oxidoreductase